MQKYFSNEEKKENKPKKISFNDKNLAIIGSKLTNNQPTNQRNKSPNKLDNVSNKNANILNKPPKYIPKTSNTSSEPEKNNISHLNE